jgi:membrane-bound lytic murein transglycosylase B
VRKLVLIAAFALASASAQAAERIDRVPAENDAPVAAAPVAAAPPATAPSVAAPPAPAVTAQPQSPRKPTYSTQTYSKQAANAQAFRSGTTLRASHERQARRIAAAYGISW